MSGAPESPAVFLVRLSAPPPRLASMVKLLSPEERTRVDAFVFDRLRPPFIVAHAALRVVLGRALGLAPSALRFDTQQFGKPVLLDAPIQFNLSHSGEWAMIAIHPEQPVGVDIEAIVPKRIDGSMIDAVTSAGEKAQFARMPRRQHSTQISASFYRLWVRKEAMIKALGTGLNRRLSTIDVPLGPEAPVDGITLRPPPDSAHRWWLWDLPPPLSYMAAVVLRGPIDEPPPARPEVRELTLDQIDPG